MIDWPDNLIQEMAFRRVIPFLGSGISASATNSAGNNPKTWCEFLKGAVNLMGNTTEVERRFVRKLIAKQQYLHALQTIYDKCDTGRYAHYLEQCFVTPNYMASNTHTRIKELDLKIVITTNFDKIYDSICNEQGYSVSTYRETKRILTNIKSLNSVIIKSHGNIDDPDNIIFTRKQYHDAQLNHGEFYDLLRALFMTNTVLFLGYSLNDPDINLVLESLSNTSSPSRPHYLVTKQGISPEIKKYWLESYNIQCLEYGPNFANLHENIENLYETVRDYRLERLMP